MKLGNAKVTAKRSAVQKRDGFGVLPCSACALASVCERKCIGCSNGVNKRSVYALMRRNTLKESAKYFYEVYEAYADHLREWGNYTESLGFILDQSHYDFINGSWKVDALKEIVDVWSKELRAEYL